MSTKWCLALFLGLSSFASYAAGVHLSHSDPIATVLLVVTAIFFFAILGRYLAYYFNQPGVLGELFMGVFVGNFCYLCGVPLIVILREGSSIFDIMKDLLSGIPLHQAVTMVIPNPYYAKQVVHVLGSASGVDYLKIAYIVDIFARYGVLFLLFMVGLETSVEELKQTGRESLTVAILGVIAPMILGFAVAYILLPSSSYQADLFIAATLSATSIGITARVLSELDQLRTREARTILGAAMLDDVLGLIILAVVSSIVINGTVDGLMVVRIICLSMLFFLGALKLAPIALRKTIHFFRFLGLRETKLFVSFLLVMGLAWLASLFHLAAIIGAFTAGVILHDNYFKAAEETAQPDAPKIHDLVSPLESVLAPIFFMVIGMQVKLEAFYHLDILILAAGLVIAAVAGKLVSGFGANKNDDRILVGIGMLPRGEVGLVFASIGRTLGVISDELFCAIVLMVIITTFIAPVLLKARCARKKEIV